MIDLPEDGDMWNLVVVLDGSQSAAAVKQSFETCPRLVALRSQVKVNFWPPTHWWVTNYAIGDRVPIVWLMDHEGKRVYKASNLASFDPEDLADEIESSIQAYEHKSWRENQKYLRYGDCGPDCNPNHQPNKPRPFSRVPDLRGPATPDGGGSSNPIAIMALVGVGGIIAYKLLRRK